MSEQYNMTRRTMLASSAFVGALAPMLTATPTLAENAAANAKASPVDISKLPREKIELVKPPFVHKHTQKAQGGPKVIEVTLTIQEKKIVVDDNGAGVPEEERAAIFERFSRGSTAARSGSGLGLALVAQQADLHGGTAAMEASPMGGARLVLRLPAPS